MGKIDCIVILMIFGTITFTAASILPTSNKIECELYDENNCTRYGDCETKIEVCKLDSDKPPCCYVLWSINPVTGNTSKIKMKGCFTYNPECSQSECITNADPRKNISFCSCRGSMCNTEHKWIPTTTEATTQVPKQKTPNENTLYVLIAALVLTILAAIFGVGLFVYRKRKQLMFNEIPTIEAEVSSSSPCLAMRPIQLLELKASGRFGLVWHGKLRNEDVAVKIFAMHEKESWNSEIDIYKLPRMRHPNILEFLGGEKHVDKITPELWLISVYHQNGSLCDYLKSHVINWQQLCRIGETMARGLMHLHEVIPATKNEGLKPAIAHRDFKSKNVLLKTDLTACIADFGLAMIFEPGKSCGDTHGQVGTRRYMAPEVLEGAINFNRDAFLRIDVYACALVLWEMVSRCDVIGPVGEFALPFEAELGQGPTLDEVQENVVMKKLRPRILTAWRTHPGLRVICDTMEECWDHDAEARLTSSCIMERFAQFNKYPITQLMIETNNANAIKESTNCL